jgi:polysaccharide deacetylase family protein (PEP-CTERM system associated)
MLQANRNTRLPLTRSRWKLDHQDLLIASQFKQDLAQARRTAKETSVKSVFSVDVEDWFHILDLPSEPDISQWDSLPSRVEQNFMKLLDIFSEKQVQVTCFFLGYIGQRFPGLVKEAHARGHEIASHGYAHRLVYQMSPDEFLEDLIKSRQVLEDIIGHEVIGFRAPGFSVVSETPWFYEKLLEAHYRYDSSVFPGSRGHGGLHKFKYSSHIYAPHPVMSKSGQIFEFPMTVLNILGRDLCFFGGGYLRFFPYWIVKKRAQEVINEGFPVMFYVHPREVDPDHPRLPMNFKRRFKSYVNLKGMERKIINILEDFELCTCRQFLDLIQDSGL